VCATTAALGFTRSLTETAEAVGTLSGVVNTRLKQGVNERVLDARHIRFGSIFQRDSVKNFAKAWITP
jgi:hypothetical protein